jgi:hypothetical protein
VGRIDGDQRTRAMLEDLHRQFPGFSMTDMASIADPRHVLETSLASAAFPVGTASTVMLMGCNAGPSAPTIRHMSVRGRLGQVWSAFPVRRRLGRGHFSAASDVGRLTPVTLGLFGPVGVLSVLTVTDRATVAAVLQDPLTMNRPSLGAALHAAADDGSFFLEPVPASIADGDALKHLTLLSRVNPGRYAVLCVSLAAGPLALLGSILVPAVTGHASFMCGLALLLAYASRVSTAVTWQSAVMGSNASVMDALLSPATDAAAFGRAVSSAARAVCPSGAARYVMRSGGLMTPTRG